MKYLKTLAILLSLSSIFALTSCEQGFEDFSAEVYSMEDTQDANGTKADEPNDSTAAGNITIIFEEPEVQDIDCTITI